ncbi:protein PFC0760c-like [Vespa crabro]|uniref:protein PFC0760c-like n=1 Tax=Vespa crabro TaxID=7445 RepID=UPI001EFFA132|nr:protein PFC0760c-like [Vespa crabro]
MAASTERSKDPYEMGFLLAPRVPQGLAAVVESLTREVLRQRPEDIYVFAARHFEKLLTLREQYDVVGKKTSGEYNFSNTIKRRSDCKESRKSKRTTKDIGATSGWSLNETARVLERHRNIFGDGEKRISTEEVRALANEKNGRSSSGTKNKREKRRSSDTSQEYSRDHPKATTDNNDSLRLDRSAKTLKIISQIPTVLTRNSGTKNIKMELRKNRLSGSLREKSTDSSNESQFPEQISDISRKSTGKAERAELIQNFEEKQINKRTIRRSESVERNSSRSSRSRRKKDSFSELIPDRKELSKAHSMDQVKEYVIRTFGSVKNINELDMSYVEQVQDVIDRNIPIIKEKIEELKNDVLSKKSKKSTFNMEKSKKHGSRPNTSENDTRSNEDQERHRNKRSSSVDPTDFRRQQDDTLEGRLINTQNILEGISSKCYSKSQNVNYRSKSTNGHSNEEDNRYSTLEGSSKITLPAVRPASSKSSRSLSRNESDNLILPPISPDTGKIPKKKDDMTLPTLSPMTTETSISSSSLRLEEKENNSVDNKTGDLGDEILQLSTSIKEDITSTRKMLENVNDALKAPMTSDDKDKMDQETSSMRDTTNDKVEDSLQETIEKFDGILDEKILEENIQVEEIFKDSLNVTPDSIDIPPTPDSLEPSIEDEQSATLNSHLSTVEEEMELKQKLIEIQEIKRNVEKVIDSFEDSIKKDEVKSPKLMIVDKDSKDSIVVEAKEPLEERIKEIIKEETFDLNSSKKGSSTNTPKSNDDMDENPIDQIKYKSENESDNINITQFVMANNDGSTGQNESRKSEVTESGDKVEDIKEITANVGDEGITNEYKNSPLSSNGKEINDLLRLSLSSSPKEIPFSYILTEGSPVEIPDFVTTVIIPERSPSTPEFDLDNKEEDIELQDERRKRAVESFGEYIQPEQTECSTVDIDFIRGIKAGHDIAIVRKDLDGIKEEEEYDEEKPVKLMDEEDKHEKEMKKDHSPLLEHISENEENEETDENEKRETKIIPIVETEIELENQTNDREEIIENVNVIENLLECEESTETADGTSESTNEVKETTITDRSTDSLSLDPARPIVPELNLDSLRDITISSFKMNDADETISLMELTLSEKEKADSEQDVEMKEEENSDSPHKEDTSAMETISMDEKPMEMEISLINLESEEINKEEHSISPEEIIRNKEEVLITSSERKIQPLLSENVEQCDTIKSDSSPLGYLELEENATDLDTEEEIAKELIEIDRAENLILFKETSTISEDNLEKSHEILDSNGTIKDSTIVEEEDLKIKDEKQCKDAISPRSESSTTSTENLKKITNTKDEKENISERMESKKSSDNEEKDQSNKSQNDNLRSDTSVTPFEEFDTNELDTKLAEKKEYHLYVTNLMPTKSQEDTSESSSTLYSAVTKIQAGVRGFLTRKRLQENNRLDSTLDNVPSIQESVTEDPQVTDFKSVSETMVDSPVKSTNALSSTTTSENKMIVEKQGEIPMTKTISMPIKQRQCLRREDAMQTNTLSMENAFASGRVQHTGEFHDCLPLPVLESAEITKSTSLSQNENKDEDAKEKLIDQQIKSTREESTIESPTNLTSESNEHDNYENIENIDRTPTDFVKDLSSLFGGLHPKDLTKLLVGQVNTPIMLGLVDIVPNSVVGTNSNVIFEANMNINANDDRTRSVKDDSTSQNRYLNFITSVEDSESSHVKDTVQEYDDHSNDHSIQSLREPLALPGTPEGVLIEELSSLDSTTISKLQDTSFNSTSLESATMDRESIEKSIIDSEISLKLLDKSDNVKSEGTRTEDNVPITKESVTLASTKPSTIRSESDEHTELSKSPKEENVENKDEMVKDNGEQLSKNEKIDEANEKTIEQSRITNLSSEIVEVDNDENNASSSDDKDENKTASLDNKDENKAGSSDDKDENKVASSDANDENKETSKDENKATSSNDKDENNVTSSDDNDKNKATSSNENDENKEASSNNKDENKAASSDDNDENKAASSDDNDENKAASSDDKDEKKAANSDNNDENKAASSDDKNEKKAASSDGNDENKAASSDDNDENKETSSNNEDEKKAASLDNNDKDKVASSDDKDEKKAASSDDNDENKAAYENKAASSDDNDENKETSSNNKDENKAASSDDNDENKAANSDNTEENKGASSNDKDEKKAASSDDNDENKAAINLSRAHVQTACSKITNWIYQVYGAMHDNTTNRKQPPLVLVNFLI